MRPRVKGALWLLLAFGLGCAAGGLGLALLQERPGFGRPPERGEEFRQAVMDRLTRELGLSEGQQGAVRAIVQETGQEFRRLREEIGPRYQAIRTGSQARIREQLDEAQRRKFEELVREWDRRIGRRHDRAPAGAGGEAKP